MIGAAEAKQYERYLGLPVMVGRSKRSAFSFVVDKIRKKISSWAHRNLSQAGKAIFIQSVLQAIPSYSMQLFKFPKSLCDDMNRLMRQVWWGNYANANYPCWLAWNTVCLSKDRGGMGFRDFEAFNDALLAKQGWRIILEPKSLASRVLKAKYFRNSGFLEVCKGHHDSFLWSSICGARYLLQDGLRWRIGNGMKVSIWKDKWLPRPPLSKVDIAGSELNSEAKVHLLIDEDEGWWNIQLLQDLFDKESVDLIVQQPMGPSYMDDIQYWNGSSNGIYTVRSGYHRALDIRLRNTASSSKIEDKYNGNQWKSLWKIQVSPSTKVFVWRAIYEILPCNALLARRHISNNALCPLCRSFEETVYHALWECSAVQDIYYDSIRRIQKLAILPASSFANFWQQITLSLDCDEVAILATTMRLTWLRRNKFVHERSFGHPSLVASQGIFDAGEYKSCLNSSKNLEFTISSSSGWKPPYENYIKINWDAALRSSPGCTGLGMIYRNSGGEVMACGVMRRPGCVDPTLAEAMGALNAIKLAADLGFSRIILEGDSKTIVDAINGGDLLFFPWRGYIIDIRQRLTQFTEWDVRFVSRTSNMAAHGLARYALLSPQLRVWIEEAPDCVSEIVLKEKNQSFQEL